MGSLAFKKPIHRFYGQKAYRDKKQLKTGIQYSIRTDRKCYKEKYDKSDRCGNKFYTNQNTRKAVKRNKTSTTYISLQISELF